MLKKKREQFVKKLIAKVVILVFALTDLFYETNYYKKMWICKLAYIINRSLEIQKKKNSNHLIYAYHFIDKGITIFSGHSSWFPASPLIYFLFLYFFFHSEWFKEEDNKHICSIVLLQQERKKGTWHHYLSQRHQ